MPQDVVGVKTAPAHTHRISDAFSKGENASVNPLSTTAARRLIFHLSIDSGSIDRTFSGMWIGAISTATRVVQTVESTVGCTGQFPMGLRALGTRWSSDSQGSASDAGGWFRSTFQGRVMRMTDEM